MTQCLILSLMILAGESLDLKNYMLIFQRIDDVIKIIPRDRALGPDGFTRKLLKYCLHIIAPVFFTDYVLIFGMEILAYIVPGA